MRKIILASKLHFHSQTINSMYSLRKVFYLNIESSVSRTQWQIRSPNDVVVVVQHLIRGSLWNYWLPPFRTKTENDSGTFFSRTIAFRQDPVVDWLIKWLLSTIAQSWIALVPVLGQGWPTFSLFLPIQSSLFTFLWAEFFLFVQCPKRQGGVNKVRVTLVLQLWYRNKNAVYSVIALEFFNNHFTTEKIDTH